MIPSHDRPGGANQVASSLTELVGHEVSGEPLPGEDGKTGARPERVTVDGLTYVLKYLRVADDWVMRASGDLEVRAVSVWRDGWLDRAPRQIDHGVIGAAWDDRPEGHGAVLVMRDLGEHLVPEGDDEIPEGQHHGFVDHMALLHATFWGPRGTPGLFPLPARLVFFGPRLAAAERARGGTDPVPTELVPQGWARLAERAPEAARIVTGLLDHPGPLVAELTATPQTFVHGDWTAGDLGSHPDGRTILLDWAIPGIAPGCLDLAWYVCLNRTRLPTSKEATFAVYREALERHGVDTAGWWEEQLALCLLGVMLIFGWEKALGDADELAWWEDRVLAGARRLAG